MDANGYINKGRYAWIHTLYTYTLHTYKRHGSIPMYDHSSHVHYPTARIATPLTPSLGQTRLSTFK